MLCGDWDGDGTDTPGLFRAADNTWHLRNSNDAAAANASFRYGRAGSGDTPLVGDWDGDGDDTPGIFRSSDNVWYRWWERRCRGPRGGRSTYLRRM